MKSVVAHYCDANHCRTEVDADKGVCPRHWAMIPPPLQARIYAVARQYKSRSLRLSSVEFLETWAEAIEHIARLEDNPVRNSFRALADAVKRRQLVVGGDPGCSGKKAYDTRTDAERAMRNVLRHDGPKDNRMNVYRCRTCRNFHFGHSSSASRSIDYKGAKRA